MFSISVISGSEIITQTGGGSVVVTGATGESGEGGGDCGALLALETQALTDVNSVWKSSLVTGKRP